MNTAIYLALPFLMAFPAVVAFVSWRNSSFKSRRLILEFLVFFAFFIFNFVCLYHDLYSIKFQNYYIRILDPLFLLFIIQSDLSYAISKERQKSLLFLIFANVFLQISVNEFLQGVYAYELLDLFTLLFSVYITLIICWEYNLTAYVPRMSRFLLVLFVIPCLLFDVLIFRILFISVVFYMSMEKRQVELFYLQKNTKNLLTEQARFRSMMNELSNSIKDFSNKKDAANSYLESLCRFLSVKGAAIYEWEDKKEYFHCVAIAGFYFPLGIGSEKLFTRADLLREIAFKQQIKDNKSAIWKYGHSEKNGVLLSHSIDDMESIFGNLYKEIHSIIIIPLLQESELLGVLVLENKTGNDYLTETDFDMAKNFANFAAIILNTSRMAMQRNENLRMSMELNSGNVVQSALFSYKVPSVRGIDLSFFMLPAKEIGGDYYDFLENEEKLAVVIGDVSGKGVSAGILVAIMQTYLQNQYKKESDLKKLIVDLNKYLSNKITAGMFFVTLLFFEWDSKQKKLRYVSCGHEHILHFHAKNKTIECIRSGGLALMMDADIDPYIKSNELVVEKGDSVILYTDGITETFNPEKQIFGLERLVEFFEKNPIDKNSIEKLLPQTLEKWRGNSNQTDDITCMLMQF
jgi:serine phosphatase RsbU (regulator of sigma subunit)